MMEGCSTERYTYIFVFKYHEGNYELEAAERQTDNHTHFLTNWRKNDTPGGNKTWEGMRDKEL